MNAAEMLTKSYWKLPWSAIQHAIQQSLQSRDNTSSLADSPFNGSPLLPNRSYQSGLVDWMEDQTFLCMHDPTQKRWTAVGNSSTERGYLCVVSINSYTVFVCSGSIDKNSCTNKTELLVMC